MGRNDSLYRAKVRPVRVVHWRRSSGAGEEGGVLVSPSRFFPPLARQAGPQTQMIGRPFCEGYPTWVKLNVAGPLPAARPYVPRNRRLVAITHTFRHIFWPQLATTSDRQPVVRFGESHCDAMVSTISDKCPQVSSQNQRVGGSIPSRRKRCRSQACKVAAFLLEGRCPHFLTRNNQGHLYGSNRASGMTRHLLARRSCRSWSSALE